MDEQVIIDTIKASKGRIFSVEFMKRDGSMRKMVCRIGVTKHLKGGELPYDALSKGLLPVWDMVAMDYRMVNLRTIISLSLLPEGLDD